MCATDVVKLFYSGKIQPVGGIHSAYQQESMGIRKKQSAFRSRQVANKYLDFHSRKPDTQGSHVW